MRIGGNEGDEATVIIRERDRTIQEKEGQVSLSHGSTGPIYTEEFDRVGGLPHASRIHKGHREVAKEELLLDGVPGGTGNVGDDGALPAQERVEEPGFTDVRAPDDDQGHPLPEGMEAA
ncbi:MAG: hypothetical protein Fur0034_06960 [Desulfuromonadia bacterium]